MKSSERPVNPRAKRAEERTPSESVFVINARQDAADRIEAVIRHELAPFVADELDRKLILDAVERRVAKLRRDVGAG